jgi:hypothetical protein
MATAQTSDESDEAPGYTKLSALELAIEFDRIDVRCVRAEAITDASLGCGTRDGGTTMDAAVAPANGLEVGPK